MHKHRNFGNFKSDLKEVKNFLKISIRAGSKFLVSAVCCSVFSPPHQIGDESCFLGSRGKRNNWNFISPLQMPGTRWESRDGRVYVPRLQQSSQTCVNHPACSEPQAGHRGMQESERKWKRATRGLKATCSPPEKKIKINTLRNSVTDMQRRSKQGLKYLG